MLIIEIVMSVITLSFFWGLAFFGYQCIKDL